MVESQQVFWSQDVWLLESASSPKASSQTLTQICCLFTGYILVDNSSLTKTLLTETISKAQKGGLQFNLMYMEQKFVKNGQCYLENHLISLMPQRCSVQFSGYFLRKEKLRQNLQCYIFIRGSKLVKARWRKKIRSDEKINFNAGSTKSWSTLQGTLEHTLQIRVAHIGSKLLGLYIPFLLIHQVQAVPAMVCLWTLQVSPSLKEVTAGHQVLCRSGWHISCPPKVQYCLIKVESKLDSCFILLTYVVSSLPGTQRKTYIIF